MDAALADSLEYATGRHVFGRAIAQHQLPAAMLGRMATRLTAARQLSYRAARRLRHGADQPEASLAKLYSSKMAESVTRDAMQVFGGMGYAEETNVSRYFLDARVLTIFEGTEEVLALRVISRTLMDR
jgi:(2S)-methylsuccinyl-CoA dehydrogenase